MTTQPLSGVKVLDFTTLLPGPLATLMLAEAGAEVIKVERPEGEELRRYLPRWGDGSAFFALLNRGKRSVSVDLRDTAARELLTPLVREADVVVEQFRPGVMTRLGLDYETVREIRPDVIYCSLTGYGQSGPKSGTAGHDINYMAETGLLALSHGSRSEPTVPPALTADIGGGSMPAVINILLALIRRDATGEGARLDLAMADALFTFAWWAHAQGHATGAWPASGGDLLTGGSPRYQLYVARDGALVAVGALEQKFWDRLCELVGLEDRLRDDARDPTATRGAMRALVMSRTGEEWREVFAGEDCAANVVRTLEEAAQDPHFAERGLFDAELEGQGGLRMPALAMPLDRQFRADPTSGVRGAPSLGADNADLLDGRGNGPDESDG